MDGQRGGAPRCQGTTGGRQALKAVHFLVFSDAGESARGISGVLSLKPVLPVPATCHPRPNASGRARRLRGGIAGSWRGECSQASWERADSNTAEEQQNRKEFAKLLEEQLVREYALGRLSAKSLCVISFLAVQSGAQGSQLEKMALSPSYSSGQFQHHLDKVLPSHPPVELCEVITPSECNGRRQDSIFNNNEG